MKLDLKKILVLSLLLLAIGLSAADNETSTGNQTDIPDGNQTEVPDGNQTDVPNGNQTDVPDGNDTLDDDTADEVSGFTSNLGAQIRLLQLENSIETNVLKGHLVIAAIKDQGGVDVSELQAILAELEVLKDEVAAVDPTEGSEAAQTYVALKKDAIDLSKEFRDLARSLLDKKSADSLRGELQTVKWNQTKTKTERIHALQREYNAGVVNETLQALGQEDDDLATQLRAGNASLTQVKTQLKAAYSNLSNEEKKQASVALKEQTSKRNVFAKAVADEAAENSSEKLQARIENRIENAQKLNVSESVQEKLQTRLSKAEEKADKLQDKTQDKVQDKTQDKLQDKTQDKTQDQVQNKTQDKVQDPVSDNKSSSGKKLEAQADKMPTGNALKVGGKK